MITLKASTLEKRCSSNLHVIKYLYEALIGAMRAQIMLTCYRILMVD